MFLVLNNHRIQWERQVPPGWELIHIPGTELRSCNTPHGIAILSEVQIGLYLFSMLYLFRKTQAPWQLRLANATAFHCVFSCSGQWHVQCSPTIQHCLTPSQCYCWKGSSFEIEPVMEIGTMLQLLWISSQEPPLSMKATDNGIFVQANAGILEQVLQLTQTSFFPQPRAFHEKLIQDLFHSIQIVASQPHHFPHRYTAAELETIRRVAMQMEKHIDQHQSIAEWAEWSGLNRQKLMEGFKSLFGTTIYGYYQNKRMQYAKELLLTTDQPIKFIAKKLGYRNTTNFSIAYKKFFGITPGGMRKTGVDASTLI